MVDHERVFREHVSGRALVYLDNNVWIDLVEERTDDARLCLRACHLAVEEGRVLFPLSNASIEELLDQPAAARPQRQADLMDLLSYSVCFRASRHIFEHEARGALDGFLAGGVSLVDRSKLFTYVIEYTGDRVIKFQPTWTSSAIDDCVRLLRKEPVLSVRWLLDHLRVDAMRERHRVAGLRYVDEMQSNIDRATTELRVLRGVKWDRAVFEERKWAFTEHIVGALREETRRRWGDEGELEFIQELRRRGPGSPKRLGELMRSLPSLDLHCELMAQRTMNPTRRVRREDILDNEHATVAPAYCDAFVTRDKNLSDLLAHRCKVPKRRGCDVLGSLASLTAWLTSRRAH